MQSFLKSGKITDKSKSKDSSQVVDGFKKKVSPNLPWVEKYRPKTVETVLEQKEAIAVLQECINGGDLPNLLFYGPPGTGKTTTILAAARQLFGEMYRDRILELNASDERGIQVIRDKIKSFAQQSVSLECRNSNGKLCPPLKIIILDEADAMTHAAQTALRRTMEKEIKTTRFCLLCNYVSKIIEPLTSRCAKFRFKPLNDSCIFDRLKLISKEENVLITDEVLHILVKESGGDMRRAVTALQSCSSLIGKSNYIPEESVYEVLTVVPKTVAQEFLDICRKNTSIKLMIKFIKNLEQQAYPTEKIYEQLSEIIINDESINDKIKYQLGELVADVSYRNSVSRSDFLHLLDFATNAQKIFNLGI